MSTSVEKNQTEMPDMPQTALGKYASTWCAQKEKVNAEKEILDRIGREIINVLHKENRTAFVIEYEGEKYRFEVSEGPEKLKVTKAAA